MNELLAISPLDGRYAESLTGFRKAASEHSLIRFRVMAEVRWLDFLVSSKEIPELADMKFCAIDFMADYIEADSLRVKEIEQETRHDVKAVEYFIRERFLADDHLRNYVQFIHFGCTSEDINNVAYAFMISNILDYHIKPTLRDFEVRLQDMAKSYMTIPMMSRTHGQAASPTTLGKELRNVHSRLGKQIEHIEQQRIRAKMNGAVGNWNAHVVAYPEINWPLLCRNWIESESLVWNPLTTQIEPHDWMAELFHSSIRCNTILIDYCRDMWTYISMGYFTQIPVEGEVGSSTMPHKINPIDFENAEGNFGIANALFDHMAMKLPVSRMQRDLSDSTVLRNVGVAFAHMQLAVNSVIRGTEKLEVDTAAMSNDLDGHVELLGEAVQTVMRRYGYTDAYEQIKGLSRGKKLNKDILHAFIGSLVNVPEEAKERLLQLTPETYVGYADKWIY